MRKVAVVGVGETKFSGPQEKTEVELFAEAAKFRRRDTMGNGRSSGRGNSRGG